MTRAAHRWTAVLLTALALAACGGDETEPDEGHTPEDAALFVNGTEVTDGLVIPAGETIRVEVRFLDHDGEVIAGIESDHHAGLTFIPTTLAAVASVADLNFQKDVTGQSTAGAGTVTVGYGHDEAADELSFGPIPVSVVATGAGTALRGGAGGR
jgi:hypothetical protein